MKKKSAPISKDLKDELISIFLIVFAIFIFLSIWKGSGENPSGAIGTIGALIYNFLHTTTGQGKILVPSILILTGMYTLLQKKTWDYFTTVSWLVLLTAGLSLIHLTLPVELQNYKSGLNGHGGGIIGGISVMITNKLLGTFGSRLFYISCIIVSLIVILRRSLADLLRSIYFKIKEIINSFFNKKSNRDRSININKSRERSESPVIIDHINNEDIPQTRIKAFEPANRPVLRLVPKEDIPIIPDGPSSENDFKLINNSSPKEYVLPSISLLQALSRTKNQKNNNDIKDRVHILEETLENFGVHAKVTQVSKGPSITRYEIQPPPGVKVSRIVSLVDDIALSLAATQVRIEAPIPGKAAVGIEVPNDEVSLVTMREVLESPAFQNSDSHLTVALGKDIAGNPIVTDLTKMPHLLIAGSTGSGKSVCMNTIIGSILFKATPNQVKMLMIDPKVVELSNFNGIPHLISPVVTDVKKAAIALRWVVHEMENRYELFAAEGVKDINRYNQLKVENEPSQKSAELPYIVLFIDELADLMMVAPADVEDAICRLAQMARAAGIHLVVATQRPSVDVLTGVIKANIPSRISFAVSSQIDSRTILDMSGAERLLGRGDMLFYPTGMAKPLRVQGAFVSDQEIDDLVIFLKNQQPVQYITPWSEQEKNSDFSSDEDDLLPEAAKLFIESGQASISLLQRRFRIGYTRAARIIDQLELKGIVGEYEGSKPRTVRMTWEEYERVFGNRDD